MAANNLRAITVNIVLGLLLTSFSANSSPNDGEVISFLKREVAVSLKALGERIEECEAQAAGRKPPVLDSSRLSELGAGAEDVMVAVAYFNHINASRCDRDERLELIYNLGMLASAERQAGDANGNEQSYEELLFPPVDVVAYRLRYAALPAPWRDYFADVFGVEPFDLTATLKANDAVLGLAK